MSPVPSSLKHDRLALLPAAAQANPASCRTALVEGGAALLDRILAQDLGPLWHHCLQSNGLLESLRPDTIDALHQARIAATVGYLAQRATLDRIDRLFEAQGIPYVAMKGSHVRESVYPDPALRPASDIDLLIAPDDRRRAAAVLLDAGFTAHAEPANISHEATFSQGIVHIDLHWHILRPGRTRVDMTAELLARRQRSNGLWRLSDPDTLFLMLIHPAFAKYVCSPNMGLARVADFLLWIQKRTADWPEVLRLLRRAGLKTAAWTMLTWFRMLAPPDLHPLLDAWTRAVRPGRLRAAYLRQWLRHDLPTRWLERPFLIQFGFTLPLHDRPADMLHAIRGLLQARKNRLRDMRLLLGEAQDGTPETTP
ncbi:MAG: hypothetical protein QG662_1401 [Pseudomonadota bacterium]|nr:hypothetical protein [Pseudomonadota bacterium]